MRISVNAYTGAHTLAEPLLPDSVPNRSIPFKEMALVVPGTSALFLFLAIASYSLMTHPLTSRVPETKYAIWLALAVHFSLIWPCSIGRVAYSIPLLLTLFGIRLLQRDRLHGRSCSGVCAPADGLDSWCSCILFDLHSTQAPELPSGSGDFWVYGSAAGVALFGRVGLTVLAVRGWIGCRQR